MAAKQPDKVMFLSRAEQSFPKEILSPSSEPFFSFFLMWYEIIHSSTRDKNLACPCCLIWYLLTLLTNCKYPAQNHKMLPFFFFLKPERASLKWYFLPFPLYLQKALGSTQDISSCLRCVQPAVHVQKKGQRSVHSCGDRWVYSSLGHSLFQLNNNYIGPWKPWVG